MFRHHIYTALAAVWDAIQLPLMLVSVFYLSGIGLYFGVIDGSKLAGLTIYRR